MVKRKIYKSFIALTKKNQSLDYIFRLYKRYLSKSYINKVKLNAIKINEVSTSFCTAKWYQQTLFLHNGMNHSCYHPPMHKISLEDIENNPAGLHNTKHKKVRRKQMIEGERPSECSYCWDIEDKGKDFLSERIYKSTDQHWSFPFVQNIIQNPDKDINPKYLEVAFSNTCNLKCSYCTPDVSSSWMDEVNKLGPFPTRYKHGNLEWIKQEGRMPYHFTENNPYVEAFWKWWPDLYKDLKVLRITGGEPLLSSHTWKILENIRSNPKKDLILSINSNLCVLDKWIDKTIEVTNSISKNVKAVEIHASCEAHGEIAEFIRFGMNYDQFINNVERFLKETNEKTKVNIMITYNNLCGDSFLKFLDDIKKLRLKYQNELGFNKLVFRVNYVTWPKYLSTNILPVDLKKKLAAEITNYSKQNAENFLENTEVDQLMRLKEYILYKPNDEDLDDDINDLSIFLKEHDIRRNTNSEKLFPSIYQFLNNSKA